jgi:hypothetical protein
VGVEDAAGAGRDEVGQRRGDGGVELEQQLQRLDELLPKVRPSQLLALLCAGERAQPTRGEARRGGKTRSRGGGRREGKGTRTRKRRLDTARSVRSVAEVAPPRRPAKCS